MILFREQNMTPQKNKGQNFLLDDDVARKIVSFIDADQAVLEIGPGLGALTKHLITKAKNLTLVEIDRGYVRFLEGVFPGLSIYNADFLKYIVPRETTTVISNIPYYITTKIIERVITKTNNLQRFVFMVETALRDRLFAKPKTKEYGPLAILLSISGTLEEKMVVTADKFYPAPHVSSTVFVFNRQPLSLNLDEFYAFTKKAFLNRRKTLSKNLKVFYSEEEIKKAFSKLQIEDNSRIEELSPTIILELYIHLSNYPSK